MCSLLFLLKLLTENTISEIQFSDKHCDNLTLGWRHYHTTVNLDRLTKSRRFSLVERNSDRETPPSFKQSS